MYVMNKIILTYNIWKIQPFFTWSKLQLFFLHFIEFASFVVSSPKDDCHDYHEEKRPHWNILDQHKFTIALKQKWLNKKWPNDRKKMTAIWKA